MGACLRCLFGERVTTFHFSICRELNGVTKVKCEMCFVQDYIIYHVYPTITRYVIKYFKRITDFNFESSLSYRFISIDIIVSSKQFAVKKEKRNLNYCSYTSKES